METHRWVDHSPFKKKPHEHGTLSDQLHENRERLVQNNRQNPQYAVNFISKTFGQIILKEIKDYDYTADEIRGFFSAVDFADTVFVHVDDKNNPYITSDSFMTVKLGAQQHALPISIFRSCLSQDIRNKFKMAWDFYKIYKMLFNFYGRKLIPIND